MLLRAPAAADAPALVVSIISPANGGGAPGQTLQAGVFAITNNNDICGALIVNSITIAFSRPSLFASAKLFPLASSQHDVAGLSSGSPPPTPATPLASTTFTSGFPIEIGPGATTDFALEVTMSPESRNEPGNVAYASIARGPDAAQPIWLAFAILGLATAALCGSTTRRVWVLAGMALLLALGAPGCGSDSSGPSSTQTVTTVAWQTTGETKGGVVVRCLSFGGLPGLPLKIGTVFGE